MTALKEYERLESGGFWRPDADTQRRDVVVSFGNATLVIADGSGRPITHWSLPAVTRQNGDQNPAIYAPAEDATETLEISDPLMIGAIEKVLKSLARARPYPRKLRQVIIALLLVATAGLAAVWLPGALRDQTLAVVPPSKRAEIGATVLGHLQAINGQTCRGAPGRAALARLRTRLLGSQSQGQIVVLPGASLGAVALPGGIIVVDQALVQGSDDPAVLAGFVLAADAMRATEDPLVAILRDAGAVASMTLLTTGDLPADTLGNFAAMLIASPSAKPTQGALVAAFTRAQVATPPYVAAMAARGTPVDLPADDNPVATQTLPLILPDADWVSLQGICDG